MRKYLIDQKFVITLAVLLAAGAPTAHANLVADFAAGCRDLIWSGKVFRGQDVELTQKWIILSDRRPQLAQVLAAAPDTLTISWFNLDTMSGETQTIPRPRRIRLADDGAYARYERDLAAGRAREAAEAKALEGKIVQLERGLGPARILSATRRTLEIEHVASQSLAVERLTIARPARLEYLTDVDFDAVTARARMVAAYPGLRQGRYVYWTPNARAEQVFDSPTALGGAIRLHFRHPVDVPYRKDLLDDLQSRGLVHARVTEVDLVAGIAQLTTPTWAIRLPLRTDVLTRSRLLESPVGVLAEVPRTGFAGFRRFRQAFLFAELMTGMAVIHYTDVGEAPFQAPKEGGEIEVFRLESFGPNYVVLALGQKRVVLRGAREMAALALGVDRWGRRAEDTLAELEAKVSVTARFAPGVVAGMPFLGDFDQIVAELAEKGFTARQLEHYAEQIQSPRRGSAFFWSEERTAQEEYKKIQVQLYASKLTGLSKSTQDFAAEVYSRATAAAREFRGFSERRSQ